MMVAQAPVQGGDEFVVRTSEPGMTQVDQRMWVTLSRHDRSQNPPPAEAQDIRGQLDIGFLQCRPNALGVTDDLVSTHAVCGSGPATPGSVVAAQMKLGSAHGREGRRSRSRHWR